LDKSASKAYGETTDALLAAECLVNPWLTNPAAPMIKVIA